MNNAKLGLAVAADGSVCGVVHMDNIGEQKLTPEQLELLKRDPAERKVYDPRDPMQSVDDQTTWKPTTNPVLFAVAGKFFAGGVVDWAEVARLADCAEEKTPLDVLLKDEARPSYCYVRCRVEIDDEVGKMTDQEASAAKAELDGILQQACEIAGRISAAGFDVSISIDGHECYTVGDKRPSEVFTPHVTVRRTIV